MNRATSQETVEAWAEAYIGTDVLATKLCPPPPPTTWQRDRAATRIERPGRPPELEIVDRAPRMPRSLRSPEARARILHRFLHHELQAAELMAWAILAFPDTPADFRAGLLAVMQDELRHMAMYERHMQTLGYAFGDFPVRDWFWERVPSCETPLQFVACLGIGFEGGNLEHAARFAERFRAVGDEVGAEVQDQVGVEEVAHVRFAVTWFHHFGGPLEFDRWVAELPEPLSPMVMRGRPLHEKRRSAAGLSAAFIRALDAWQPDL